MANSEMTALLKKHFTFWENLSDTEKELLLENISLIKYEKGTNIHNGDNDCIGVLLVKSGTLRTYMLSENGKEITLYRLFEGDICVMSASCVLRQITFEVLIDAEEDCEILLISSAYFAQLCAKNIYVECFSYKQTAARFSDVMWAMQQILFMSFDKRLAVFLADELAKNGGDTIKLTHEQVAKYMGSAREVVTRMLKYFANEGIVELSRGGIKVLDKKRLRNMI